MNVIIRDSKLPIYHQLYEILRTSIIGGQWQPGDMLPSESELIEQYQVSRITVRQALDALVNEGLIYRQRGRGTFVAHPTVEQGLTRIISFTADMRQRGFVPSTRVLAAALKEASSDIADKLQVPAGTQLAFLERLRLADGEPMSIEQSFLVHHFCPGIMSGDYAQEPLREVLEESFGVRLVRASQVIRAVAAPRRLADLLEISSGAPMLAIERISYSPENTPIEFLRLYHRGDRYALYNELRD